ncbi:MAG TPA: DUF3995 domain-containing protein [Kofleriaceae bacterium]|nr:DUF3995 domain-containing protein [Kofleriaceae bacterium]
MKRLTPIAITTAAILVALAALHLIWLRSVWPFASADALVRNLIGTTDVARAPTAAPTVAVAVALLGAAWLTLAGVDVARWPLPSWCLRWGLRIAAAVLLLRGGVGFLVSTLWTSRVTPEFAHWNALIYSPLTVGLGVALLLVERRRTT